ncbi:MAG: class I SAM-dependent methyltransferase [Sinimarinibacterium flocculans]|uniref:class I SAM-dependent methyltransferase n=1 Tax=Sinimarinibacterium flocculans TaxID=985250 RepID=UPI003C38D778
MPTTTIGTTLGAVALLALGLGATPAHAAFDAATAKAVDAALAGDHRSVENKARDVYRKPREVLEFVGLRRDMTVVEMSPGAGWYTEILGPVLADQGRLYAAQFALNDVPTYQRRLLGSFLTKLAATPDLYKSTVITHFAPPYALEVAPRGSADLVLTFRNLHNWAAENEAGVSWSNVAFKAMHDALKPGGTLGIVDHRWPDPKTENPADRNGYISEERTIRLAEAAGFRFAARSELLRNPKDTHDHPRGVWTLPPSLALGEQDRDRYLAIGESDRYLLTFTKPTE